MFTGSVRQRAKVRFIFSTSARVTRLHTNSPVALTLEHYSFDPDERGSLSSVVWRRQSPHDGEALTQHGDANDLTVRSNSISWKSPACY